MSDGRMKGREGGALSPEEPAWPPEAAGAVRASTLEAASEILEQP